MKLGLIKKSLVCVLSLSFCAVLASCKKASNNDGTLSKSKVFANKEIMAYAKKYNNNMAQGTLYDCAQFDAEKYNLMYNEDYYAVLQEKSTAKKFLYLRNSNKIIDIDNNGEDIDDIYTDGGKSNNYGYIVIAFDNGEKTIVDYNGNILIEKKAIYQVEFDSISDGTSDDEEEVKFYDIISYTESGDAKKDVYKVIAKVVDGKTSNDFTRTALESDEEIDYSIYHSEDYTLPLKEYDIFTMENSFVVKDLKGNIKSSFTFSGMTGFYVLGSKATFQTTSVVTSNDDYDYYMDNKYYVLKTFQIDLNTGVKKEIKDYAYAIDSVDYIPAYNESKDRIYVGAIYAGLRKVENKNLSNFVTTAMIDENGKIISNKIGEKGKELFYLNDNTYVLYDDATTTILDKKGNAKASFYSRTVIIDYENELIFAITEMSTGASNVRVLDTDLKLYDVLSTNSYNALYAMFSNGNVIMNISDHESALIKFENKKATIIEKFDFTNRNINLNPAVNNYEGCRYVIANSNLASLNLYLVEIKTSTGWDVEVHSADGTLVKKIENVIDLNLLSSLDYCFPLIIETATTYYYFGATFASTAE